MSTPVFILAGQSNAFELSNEIGLALDDRYGVGNYEFLNVFASGAPLTRERENHPDWSDPAEMRDDLTTGLIDALNEDPDTVVGGMIWVQGEADTYFGAGASRYGEALETLIDDFREDITRRDGDRETGLDCRASDDTRTLGQRARFGKPRRVGHGHVPTTRRR